MATVNASQRARITQQGDDLALARYDEWMRTIRSVMGGADASHTRLAEMLAELDVRGEVVVRQIIEAKRRGEALPEPVARLMRRIDDVESVTLGGMREIATEAWRSRFGAKTG